MIDFYKNSNRLLLCFLFTFFLCSNSLLNSKANITEDETATAPLRGEIWYGNASWYGSKFHGRKTSNGEKFNKHKLTAAHKSLPFNTMVLVTNLKNNKSVVVRINDRGPYKNDRIIDLSEAAAKEIDIKKQGIAYIKLQVVSPTLLSIDQKVADKIQLGLPEKS